MTERGDVPPADAPLLHPERPALNTQPGSKAQTQTGALSPTRLGQDLEEKNQRWAIIGLKEKFLSSSLCAQLVWKRDNSITTFLLHITLFLLVILGTPSSVLHPSLPHHLVAMLPCDLVTNVALFPNTHGKQKRVRSSLPGSPSLYEQPTELTSAGLCVRK